MTSYKLQEVEKKINAQSHRDLKVFQRSYAISLEIYRISQKFPDEHRFGITGQIRRSASGVCANIAEGYGRQIISNPDFKRFLAMAIGSCHETGVWIDYCLDLNLIDENTYAVWQQEYLEISKMLFGLIKSL